MSFDGGTEMECNNKDKVNRVLEIYSRLLNGHMINKAEEAQRYQVTERSIQRDIEDIRSFFERSEARAGVSNSVVYDRIHKAYRLEHGCKTKLSNGELLAICKILLASRAFSKVEMERVLDGLFNCYMEKEQKRQVLDLVRNEEFHYVDSRATENLADQLWSIGEAIRLSQYIQILYSGENERGLYKVRPVGILFSKHQFYLAAFSEEEGNGKETAPKSYCIDDIIELTVLEEKFHIPYRNRFEEGEFRKRIRFADGE